MKKKFMIPPPEKITDWKHPANWLELGADLRLRAEYDNNRKLDKEAVGHERVVFPRFRARAGAKIKLTDDIDFNTRFVMEPRYYIRPPSQDPQFTRNEVLLDKFNLTWRNAFDLPPGCLCQVWTLFNTVINKERTLK